MVSESKQIVRFYTKKNGGLVRAPQDKDNQKTKVSFKTKLKRMQVQLQ